MNEKKRSPENGIDELWGQTEPSIDEIRLKGMADFRNMALIGQALFQREAARLEKELGKDHPRPKKIQARLKTQARVVSDLEIELELAKIKVPPVPNNGALVHGRVVDLNHHGIAGLKVIMEDEKGRLIKFLGQPGTNASGYFSFAVDEKKLRKLAPLGGMYLMLSTRGGRVVYRKPDAIEAAAGDRIVVNVNLHRTDLYPVQDDGKPGPNEDEDNGQTANTWAVNGRVKDAFGNALAGVTVSLFDKELVFDDRLGISTTDKNGDFSFTYQVADFSDLIESNPDLYVEVRDQDERLLYSSRKTIRFEAGKEEIFNIRNCKRTIKE